MNPTPVPRGTCRHCGRGGLILRPRGLCNAHYIDLAVRALYPVKDHRSTRRGHPEAVNPPAPEPCAHGPGTLGKLEALAARAAAGLALHHAADAADLSNNVPADLLDVTGGVKRRKQTKVKKVAPGPRCTRCKEPAAHGFKQCLECRAYFLGRWHARKERRATAAGLRCTRCLGPCPVPGFRQCAECREKKRGWYHTRRRPEPARTV